MSYSIKPEQEVIIMENKEFKKLLESILEEHGFHRAQKKYYYDHNEFIIALETQKSDYDNSFYINYGYCVKAVNPTKRYPVVHECDTFARFIFCIDNEEYDRINLDTFNASQIEKAIRFYVEKNILPVIQRGIKHYYEITPEAIHTTTEKARKFLF